MGLQELGHLFHCHHVANAGVHEFALIEDVVLPRFTVFGHEVRITFKEAIGVQGRWIPSTSMSSPLSTVKFSRTLDTGAGYFDGYGIIRDIMQQLTQCWHSHQCLSPCP